MRLPIGYSAQDRGDSRADRAPVAVRQEVLVVPRFAVHTGGKHGDHALLRLIVKVVHAVALVQHVCQQIRRRSVDNGRRDDVGHVAEVLVLSNTKLGVGVELPDSGQMHIATMITRQCRRSNEKGGEVLPQDGHPDRFVCRKILQILNQVSSLGLVVFRRPMVVEDLDLAAILVDKTAKHAGLSEGLSAVEDVFHHCLVDG